MQYPAYDHLPIHLTGSIAFYYQEVLRSVADTLQLKLGRIEQAPMPGLISFHAK